MVQGLYIGKNALMVNQAALTVVSNNIANANTIGYSKQRVNLVSMQDGSIASNAMQQAKLGYGVDIESITRYRDSFIDSYYRNAVSSQAYYQTISEQGLAMENLANEFSGSGLSSYMNSFFAAANNVSLYPTDITMKTDFIQQASNLANAINNIATQLQETRTNLVGDVNNPVTLNTSEAKVTADEINQLLNDIATINETIIYQHNSNVGASSGILDQRDAMLDELAQYIPITVDENANGGVNVSLGSVQLVGGTNVKGEFKINLGDNNNPTVISFENSDGYVYSHNIKDLVGDQGKLGAILTLGGNSDSEVTVKSMLDNLNLVANEFAKQINNIQLKNEAGPPPMTSAYYDAASGELKNAQDAIFIPNDGASRITAFNITVNQAILNNPHKIATAYVQHNGDAAQTITNPTEIGNNYGAQAMADLRLESIVALNGQTFEDFNTSITSEFGAKLSSAKTNLETQDAVYQSAFEQRESTIGVNIEEELIDLVKYQRAYESSARVFTVANEILQTLVSLGR